MNIVVIKHSFIKTFLFVESHIAVHCHVIPLVTCFHPCCVKIRLSTCQLQFCPLPLCYCFTQPLVILTYVRRCAMCCKVHSFSSVVEDVQVVAFVVDAFALWTETGFFISHTCVHTEQCTKERCTYYIIPELRWRQSLIGTLSHSITYVHCNGFLWLLCRCSEHYTVHYHQIMWIRYWFRAAARILEH